MNFYKSVIILFLFFSPLFAGAERGLEFLGLSGNDPGDLLVGLYQFAMGLVGISALVMLVFGAVIYMTAGDSQSRVKEGTSYMKNAMGGLILALVSWLILNTINPDLVKKLELNLTDITLKSDVSFQALTRQEFIDSPSTSQYEKDVKNIVKNQPDTGLPIIEVERGSVSAEKYKQALLDGFTRECASQGGDFMTTGTVQAPGGKATFECKKCKSGPILSPPSVFNNSQMVGFVCK